MANLKLLPRWTEGVYQLEETDPVMGGENGIDNQQAKDLGNRTEFLRQENLELRKLLDTVKEELKNEIETNATLIRKTVPAGVVLFLAGPVEPEGWMICNGRKLKKSEFPDLFNAIGTTWGGGDDYFNLPESFEDYLRCASSKIPVGTKQGDAMRNLTGSFAIGNTWLNDYTEGVFYNDSNKLSYVHDAFYTEASSAPLTRVNTGYNLEGQHLDASRQVPTANEFRPKTSVMWAIIKY